MYYVITVICFHYQQLVSDAKLFKAKFEEAKKIVAEECDLYNGKGDEEPSSDDESDECQDNSTSEDRNYEEVTKKISELDVTKEKN